jgi:hypothetical protein
VQHVSRFEEVFLVLIGWPLELVAGAHLAVAVQRFLGQAFETVLFDLPLGADRGSGLPLHRGGVRLSQHRLVRWPGRKPSILADEGRLELARALGQLMHAPVHR